MGSARALRQEGNLRAPLQDTEMRSHLILLGNGNPEKPELLLEGRSRRADHTLPLPALHGLIYQMVMKKQNKQKKNPPQKKPQKTKPKKPKTKTKPKAKTNKQSKQGKTCKERNNWIEVVQPGLLCLPACPDKCHSGKSWRPDTVLKFRSSNRE